MTVETYEGANPEFGFGDRIRKIRRDIAHMTQTEMAATLGVSQKAYAAWESGRNQPDNLVAIAKKVAFRWRGQVTASWVLGVDTPITPPPGGGGGALLLPRMDSNHQPSDHRSTTKLPAITWRDNSVRRIA